MIRKRTAVIVAVGVVGLVVAISLYFLFSSPEVIIESHKPVEAAQVRVDSLSSYLKDLQVTTQTEKNIKEQIYMYLKESGVTQLGSINGAVRESSYKSTTDGNIISIEFLVDFNAIKRSYKISIGRDSVDDITTSYIICPSLNEMVYPSSACKDSQSE